MSSLKGTTSCAERDVFPEELRACLEVPCLEGATAALGASDEAAFRPVDRAVLLNVDAEGFRFFRDMSALRANEETMQVRTVKPKSEPFGVHGLVGQAS